MNDLHLLQVLYFQAESQVKLLCFQENLKVNGGYRSVHQAETDLEENARQIRTFLLRAEEDKRRLAQRIDKLIANGTLILINQFSI